MLLEKDERIRVEKIIDIKKVEKKYIRSIKSIHKTKKIEAIVYLGILGTEGARQALEGILIHEKDYIVKLYIANALADIGKKQSISVLVASLLKSNLFYRERVNALIAEFGEEFNELTLSL